MSEPDDPFPRPYDAFAAALGNLSDCALHPLSWTRTEFLQAVRAMCAEGIRSGQPAALLHALAEMNLGRVHASADFRREVNAVVAAYFPTDGVGPESNGDGR